MVVQRQVFRPKKNPESILSQFSWLEKN